MMSRRREESPTEMQIAPMADIGFLLLCFSSFRPNHRATRQTSA